MKQTYKGNQLVNIDYTCSFSMAQNWN